MKRVRVDVRWLTSENAQVVVTALAICGLLAYTFRHTATMLARYIEPDWYGLVAAACVEFSIVAFALRIGQKRKAAKADAAGKVHVRGVGGLRFVIVAALIVSALANLSEGYAAAHGGAAFGLDSLRRMDAVQAVILVAATALISFVVYALSDIIGGDVRAAADASERAERRERKAADEAAETVADVAPVAVQTAAVLRLPVAEAQPFRCSCGQAFGKQQSLAGHQRRCAQWQTQKGKAVRG